jgi:hypothetical protein
MTEDSNDTVMIRGPYHRCLVWKSRVRVLRWIKTGIYVAPKIEEKLQEINTHEMAVLCSAIRLQEE